MSVPVLRLEFYTSYSCPNRCLFCSEAGRLKRFRGLHPAPREIAAVLRAKREAGFTHVTFTGGEPAVPGFLPQTLGIAKALGYKTCIATIGAAFAEAGYAARVLPLLDEMILSVHGPDAGVHDALTGNPGSFAAARAALENIEKYAGERIFLITNTLALRSNLAALPATLRGLAGFRAVKQFLVSYPAPEGRAFTNYARLAPGLKTFGNAAGALVEIALRAGKEIRFFGVPACTLGVHAGYSNDLHWSPRLTVERAIRRGTVGFREVLSIAPVRRRFYAAKCLSCALLVVCGGFFAAGGISQGLPRSRREV